MERKPVIWFFKDLFLLPTPCPHKWALGTGNRWIFSGSLTLYYFCLYSIEEADQADRISGLQKSLVTALFPDSHFLSIPKKHCSGYKPKKIPGNIKFRNQLERYPSPFGSSRLRLHRNKTFQSKLSVYGHMCEYERERGKERERGEREYKEKKKRERPKYNLICLFLEIWSYPSIWSRVIIKALTSSLDLLAAVYI